MKLTKQLTAMTAALTMCMTAVSPSVSAKTLLPADEGNYNENLIEEIAAEDEIEPEQSTEERTEIEITEEVTADPVHEEDPLPDEDFPESSKEELELSAEDPYADYTIYDGSAYGIHGYQEGSIFDDTNGKYKIVNDLSIYHEITFYINDIQLYIEPGVTVTIHEPPVSRLNPDRGGVSRVMTDTSLTITMGEGSTLNMKNGFNNNGTLIIQTEAGAEGTTTLNIGGGNYEDGFYNRGTLEFRNMNINGYYKDKTIIDNYGTFVSENCIFNTKYEANTVLNRENSSFTMNGGEITGNGDVGVMELEHSIFSLNNGMITGHYYGVVQCDGSELRFDSGTITGNKIGVIADDDAEAKVYLQGSVIIEGNELNNLVINKTGRYSRYDTKDMDKLCVTGHLNDDTHIGISIREVTDPAIFADRGLEIGLYFLKYNEYTLHPGYLFSDDGSLEFTMICGLHMYIYPVDKSAGYHPGPLPPWPGVDGDKPYPKERERWELA